MASSTTSIAKVWVSEGPQKYGLDWSKIPKKEEVESALSTVKSGHPEQYQVLFAISAQTGLRICEVIHLRCEDLLPDNHMRVTRRKKRVLHPVTIDVFPSIWKVMAAWCKGRKGWMFPGAAQPCVINRAPRFEETNCPDCGHQILRMDQMRKRYDRIQAFVSHLTQAHDRSPDEIQEWIEFSKKDCIQQVCNGGHLHIRTAQTRWRLVLTEAGGYVPGRGIHALRHNFGVELYKATHDIVKVKQLLGHENVTTTQVYATAVDTKETLEKLDGTI